VGTLELQEEVPPGSGSWVAIWSRKGHQPGGWTSTGTIVPMANPTTLRFAYLRTATLGFRGDAAIDDADLR